MGKIFTDSYRLRICASPKEIIVRRYLGVNEITPPIPKNLRQQNATLTSSFYMCYLLHDRYLTVLQENALSR